MEREGQPRWRAEHRQRPGRAGTSKTGEKFWELDKRVWHVRDVELWGN